MDLASYNQFLRSAIMLQIFHPDGSCTCGTSFLQEFLIDGLPVYALVTNRHVLAEGNRLICHLPCAESTDGMITYKRMDLSALKNIALLHPNPEVDLALFPINMFIFGINQLVGKHLCCSPIPFSSILAFEDLEKLSGIEDILMFGFPNAIFDDKNYLPLCRRGITSTHPALAFQGSPSFLCDITTGGGSSGSPIFRIDGLVSTPQLLGIHSATATISTLFSKSHDNPGSLHLGIAIRSSELFKFIEPLKYLLSDDKTRIYWDSSPLCHLLQTHPLLP